MACLYCQTPLQACTHFELLQALQDVKCSVVEYGISMEFRLRKETQVRRDKYQSIKRFDNTQVAESPIATVVTVKAYPVTTNPSQKELDRAGLREVTDLSAWVPRQYWIDAGIEFDDVDMERTTVIFQGSEYEIRDKAQQSQFREDFLYWTFGLNKR